MNLRGVQIQRYNRICIQTFRDKIHRHVRSYTWPIRLTQPANQKALLSNAVVQAVHSFLRKGYLLLRADYWPMRKYIREQDSLLLQAINARSSSVMNVAVSGKSTSTGDRSTGSMNLTSKSSDAVKVLTEESYAPNKHSHNSFNDLHEQ